MIQVQLYLQLELKKILQAKVRICPDCGIRELEYRCRLCSECREVNRQHSDVLKTHNFSVRNPKRYAELLDSANKKYKAKNPIEKYTKTYKRDHPKKADRTEYFRKYRIENKKETNRLAKIGMQKLRARKKLEEQEI